MKTDWALIRKQWKWLVFFCLLPFWQTNSARAAEEVIRNVQPGDMLVKQGDVKFREATKSEISAAQPQPLGFGDSLHTLQLARATVRFIDWSTIRMKELTVLEVQGATQQTAAATLKLHQGQVYVSSRGPTPVAIPIDTPHVHTVPKGTEFLVSVDLQAARTEVTMFDGEAQLQGTSDAQPVRVRSGQQGISVSGQPTQVRPILQAQNIVQWWLYYPGILEANEIGLTTVEQAQLAPSLAAYRQGDLQQALMTYPGYPSPPEPTSDAQRSYLAGLFLAVGAVDRSDALLNNASSNTPPVRALRTMIRAVTTDFLYLTNRTAPLAGAYVPETASEWLALSYAHQATNNLKAALEDARRAIGLSPTFGFDWARIGELEFSFGRTRAAREAALRAIKFSPRNAQAHALNGFLLAAENRIHQAIGAFDQAIEIDPGLGNAWLGRGLCKRRLGWFYRPALANQPAFMQTNWLADLQTAASLEPTRSLARSYAGKAFGDAGDERLARKELNYALKLDPNDPTPWLYRALLDQEENRINEAVADLEGSQERNENRSLFRSRLLLDEDRAVRSANLAAIYRDAGMFDVSVREASRAVTADYGNYSSHLFLANSYNELRDPALVTLRYETATFSEYLLANLLSPVGGSALSPYVSQQEYSRLFEQNRLGLSSQTDYSSRGDWQEQASQFGWFNDSAYAVDVFYRSINGQRPNNDIEQQAYSALFKQQLTSQDSVYLQAVFNDYESGDVRQVYNPSDTNQFSPNLRINEKQQPNLFLGYHHEWSPGVHTLFLGGRLEDNFDLSTSNLLIRGVERAGGRTGPVTNTVQGICQAFKDRGEFPPDFDVATCDLFDALNFHSDFEAYSAELQQIVEVADHTVIFGGRFQDGDAETQTREVRLAGHHFPTYPGSSGQGSDFVSTQHHTTDLMRLSFYGYDQWHVIDPLWLTAGLSYDRLHYPVNVDSPPVSAAENTTDRVSPKAGFIWTPWPETTLRGAYTRSLGGLFYDNSVRLEPVQIAGFNQAYRSLIPESIAGSIPGSRFETLDFGFEQRLRSRTYIVLGTEALKSEASRDIGVFDYPSGVPSQIDQSLKYEEYSLVASLNQLIGREWALGARYKVSNAELRTDFPGVPAALIPSTKSRAVLHNLNLFAIYNHPSGVFAEGQALWAAQHNYDSSPGPGDELWQFNLLAGYRFPRRQAQISIGILNLTSQDYRLNPLNLYTELPRHRTFVASLKFSF